MTSAIVTTAMKKKLNNSGTIATFNTWPHVFRRESPDTEIISFWINKIRSTTTDNNASDATSAILVTVVTVVVVTVEIIQASQNGVVALFLIG